MLGKELGLSDIQLADDIDFSQVLQVDLPSLPGSIACTLFTLPPGRIPANLEHTTEVPFGALASQNLPVLAFCLAFSLAMLWLLIG